MKQKSIYLTTIIAIALSIIPFHSAGNGVNTMPIENMRLKFLQQRNHEEIRLEINQYLDSLNAVLLDADKYRQLKQQRISDLIIRRNSTSDLNEKFNTESELFKEYAQWSYDSMFHCSRRCLRIAQELNNKDMIVESRIKMANTAMEGGYFRIADHIICATDTAGCSDKTKTNFLISKFDLNFEDGFYYRWYLHGSDIFLPEMEKLKAEAMILSGSDKLLEQKFNMKLAFHSHDYNTAVNYVAAILAAIKHDDPEYPTWSGNMGYNLMGEEKYPESLKYMVQSAIADIKRGSRNVVAMRKIAELEYIIGDIQGAYKYISIAMDNAQAYNSKYRISEASMYYPSIDKNLYTTIQKQRQRMLAMMVILSCIVIMLAIATFIVIWQKKKQNRLQQVISSQNEELKEKSEQIEQSNRSLIEAHHIKDILLGQILTKNADTHLWIEKTGKDVLRKLKIKDYEGIKGIFTPPPKKSADSEEVREIDRIILAIYPDFCRQFNSLLKPDNKMTLKTADTLCPEMRIFALIRLGISKNDDIAKCLNYSVNTIKSYKTKVVNMSAFSVDQFYEKLHRAVINECKK